MKLTFLLLLVVFTCIISCQKEDFTYTYPETDRLLVSIIRTEGDSEYRTEFKYDSLNRIVEIQSFIGGERNVLESFVYNKQGRIVEKHSGTFKHTYKYNERDQLVEQNTHFTPKDGKWEWDVKTEYKYKSGRISKGIIYPRKYVGLENSGKDGELGYISYKYDSNGNTEVQNSRYDKTDVKYDNKINPLAVFGVLTVYGYSFYYTFRPDIKQVNNPVYSYQIIGIMSSFPPECEISYEYDMNDLPINAEIKDIGHSGRETAILEFRYQPKN